MPEAALSSPLSAPAALRFLLDSGVDCFVDERPRNWLATPAVPAAPVTAAPRKQAALPEKISAQVQVRATSLEALAEEVGAHPHPLNTGETGPMLLEGTEAAPLLVLTDTRLPEGSEGARLLGAMLAAIGMGERAASLPLLPWPTPGGRTARPEELADFAPFARAALKLARPRLVLAFGPHVAGPLLGRAVRAGDWDMLDDMPILTTLSPALLLRTPTLKAEAWAHLQSLATRLA